MGALSADQIMCNVWNDSSFAYDLRLLLQIEMGNKSTLAEQNLINGLNLWFGYFNIGKSATCFHKKLQVNAIWSTQFVISQQLTKHIKQKPMRNKKKTYLYNLWTTTPNTTYHRWSPANRSNLESIYNYVYRLTYYNELEIKNGTEPST